VESGFDVFNGSVDNNRLFNRQAWVGLSGSRWGEVTLGRQYDSMVDYLSPLSLANMDDKAGGRMFAHPFSNDNLNGSFRINNSVNNSVKYASPDWNGFSFGTLLGASNEMNGLSDDNRACSLGVKYENGPLRLAVSYLALNEPNGARNLGGAVSNDYALQADKQMTFGAGASYVFAPATVGFGYIQSKIDGAQGFGNSPMPAASGTSDVNVSNYELNGKYSLTPAWLVSASYVYSNAKYTNKAAPAGGAAGINSRQCLTTPCPSVPTSTSQPPINGRWEGHARLCRRQERLFQLGFAGGRDLRYASPPLSHRRLTRASVFGPCSSPDAPSHSSDQ
jgi:general bacterial porin, GBP family